MGASRKRVVARHDPQMKAKNDVVARGKVATAHIAVPEEAGRLVLDFSADSAWRSCRKGDYSSYLKGEAEFVEKFRKVMDVVRRLSDHSPHDVFNTGSFRHCHSLPADKAEVVVDLITSELGVSEQEVAGETFLQVGLSGELRMVGTLYGNVLRVYLVDYNHCLFKDERKNRRNKSQDKFCPIRG